MSRNLEGRIAKLEAGNDVGKGEFIFAITEPGETGKAFDRRVERLILESTERCGAEPVLIFKFVLNHEEKTK